MRTAFPAALALVLPAMVAAQSTTVSPSFSASEKYDDNLFATTEDPQRTFVHGFGPRVELAHRSEVFSLIGRYALDAEYVQELPEQGFVVARQLGSINLGYRPMKRLAFTGEAAYLDTRTSVELSTTTALDRGRVRARRLSVAPAIDYELDQRTRGKLGYEVARDDILGSTTDSHVANAELAHRFTRIDTGTASVIVRELVFDGAALAPSEVALLGWTRRLARRTSASAQAGPRFREAELEGAELAASLRHGIGPAELEARYTRTETVTSGLSGSFETDAADVSASLRVAPSMFLADAGVARTHGTGLRADVLHTRVAATTRVNPWLSVELALSLSWQRLQTSPAAGSVDAAGVGIESHLFHDVAALTFVVAPPKPIEL